VKQSLLFILLMTMACSSPHRSSVEEDRAAILETEAAFALMAQEEGIAAAFFHYAADSAVISRGNRMIRGGEAIRDYYLENLNPGTRLQWTPEYVEVSGDLGYTWGRYYLSVPDSPDTIRESTGIFHTVWKRQPDGSWRYVWD
jgi:ketosteroid isomerase-like protein